MIGVLEAGIEMAHQGKLSLLSTVRGKVKTPSTASLFDPKLRMEKFLVKIVNIIHCYS